MHASLIRLLIPITLLSASHTLAADAPSKPSQRNAQLDRPAVICANNGNCIHVRRGFAAAQADLPIRRSPLWLLEDIFFN